MHLTQRSTGLLLGVFAAAMYGLNPLFVLPLYKAGVGMVSILTFRSLFAILLLAMLMKVRGLSFAVSRKELTPLFLLGILFTTSALCLYEGYRYLDVGIASTLLFVYPVFVAIISALFFKEKLPALTVIAIALSLAGILLLYRNGTGGSLSLFGIFLVCLSALAYAVFIVLVNSSSVRNFPTVKLVFYALIFGLPILLLRSHCFTELEIPGEPHLWLNLFYLALFPTIISLIAMTRSILYIGATPASILGALEPLTGLFCGVVVFGEQLTLRVVIGVIMVLISVSIVVAAAPLSAWVRQHFRGTRQHFGEARQHFGRVRHHARIGHK